MRQRRRNSWLFLRLQLAPTAPGLKTISKLEPYLSPQRHATSKSSWASPMMSTADSSGILENCKAAQRSHSQSEKLSSTHWGSSTGSKAFFAAASLPPTYSSMATMAVMYSGGPIVVNERAACTFGMLIQIVNRSTEVRQSRFAIAKRSSPEIPWVVQVIV